jgi:hypothetical protein
MRPYPPAPAGDLINGEAEPQAASARLARATRAGVLTAALLAAWPAWADPVAEVVALRGFASLSVAGKTKPLKVGRQVEEGWEIRTAAPGRVKLRFSDGSVMVIGDGSRLRIEKFRPEAAGQPRQAGFMLDIGLISQVVTPSRDGQWSVRTPSAITAVRGTEYMVEVSRDLVTDVHVQTGAVTVEPARKVRMRGVPEGPAPEPLLLDQQNLGASCNATGECQPTKALKEERIRALVDRLSGV